MVRHDAQVPLRASFLATLLTAVVLAGCPAVCAGQSVKVTAGIEPSQIQVGDSAQLSVEVSSEGSGISLQSINVPPVEGLQIDPQGQSQNFQIVNGAVTMVFTQTYAVVAQRAGHFTIGPAQVTSSIGTTASSAVRLDVGAAGSAPGSPSGQPAPGGARTPTAVSPQGPPPGTGGAQMPWIEATLSRKRIYEGESVLYQSRLYSPFDFMGARVVKDAEFTGFRVEPIKTDNNPTRTSRGSQPLLTAQVSRRLIIATRPGRFMIRPETLQVDLRAARRRSADPFDVFDNDPFDIFGARVVRRDVSGKEILVEVLPLPSKDRPADFSGLVGSDVVLGAHPDKEEVKSSEVLTYAITVRGTGDVGALPDPHLDFGAEFKQYPVKSTKQVQTTDRGLIGTRTFEYVLAPLHVGVKTLPGVTLSYFDTNTHKYIQLRTPPVTIRVTGVESEERLSAGMGTGHEVELLGTDLGFIKDDLDLAPLGPAQYKRPEWWALVTTPIVLLALAWALQRIYLRRIGDVRRMRSSRAMRKALAELEGVEQSMVSANARDLYAHIDAALTGYVADKLDLPRAGLGIDEMRGALDARSVAPQHIDRLVAARARCQEVRFASAGAAAQSRDVAEARALLGDLEEVLG